MYKRYTKKLDRENFVLDLISIDWPTVLQLENEDPNLFFEKYFTTINTLIDKYMPLEKITPKEVKQQYKSWISKEILNSIRMREKLYKQFVKAKDKDVKEDYHKKYKQIRDKIFSECRESKKLYFQNYFTENANNTKNMRKGIKSIINISSYSKGQASSLLVNNEHISDPKLIAETFNNYFSSIASELRGKIHQHGKDFSCYLKNSNPNDFSSD